MLLLPNHWVTGARGSGANEQMQVENSSETLTTRQAADLLGMSITSVQKMVEAGELEAWVTPGGHRRIRRGDGENGGDELSRLGRLHRGGGRLVREGRILERLRGHAAEDLLTRAVDILVSRLRKKLEPLDCIRTLRGVGYAFAAGPAA